MLCYGTRRLVIGGDWRNRRAGHRLSTRRSAIAHVTALLIALILLLIARSSEAGSWQRAAPGSGNVYHFAVANGEMCAVAYHQCGSSDPWCLAGDMGVTYDGSLLCSWGGVFHSTLTNRAERVAMGPIDPVTGHSQLFWITMDGVLNYTQNGVRFAFYAFLPQMLIGTNSKGIVNLVYQFLTDYGSVPQNPLWILGADQHVYHLTDFHTQSQRFVDAGMVGAIGLSYSPSFEYIMALRYDGTTWAWDDAAGQWFEWLDNGPGLQATGGVVSLSCVDVGNVCYSDFRLFGLTTDSFNFGLDTWGMNIAWMNLADALYTGRTNDQEAFTMAQYMVEGGAYASALGLAGNYGALPGVLQGNAPPGLDIHAGKDVLWLLNEFYQVWGWIEQ
jgi:hypothetical protein